MKNNTDQKKTIINYGLIFGGFSILLNIILYAMDKSFEPGFLFSSLSFIIPVVLIFLGIKNFKKLNNNLISWKQAVKIGVGIAIVGTLLSLAYQQFFENFIEPDFNNQKIEFLKEQYSNKGLSEEQIDAQLERIKNFNTPLFISAVGIMRWAFIGFVISAIIGLIIKKEENVF